LSSWNAIEISCHNQTETLPELQALIPESKKSAAPPSSKPEPLAPGEIPGATVPGSNGAPTPEEQARLDQMLGK
jgi:hypothetical protein